MTTHEDMIGCGWERFQPDNSDGWKFYMRRNAEYDPRAHINYYAAGFDYCTLFNNGNIAEGIIESAYIRRKVRERKRESILFRKF